MGVTSSCPPQRSKGAHQQVVQNKQHNPLGKTSLAVLGVGGTSAPRPWWPGRLPVRGTELDWAGTNIVPETRNHPCSD